MQSRSSTDRRHAGSLAQILCVAVICVLTSGTLLAQKAGLGKGFGQFGAGASGFGGPATGSNMTFDTRYELEVGSKKGRLIIAATIADGWHTYSMTQQPGGPKISQIKLKSDFLKLTTPFSADQDPEIKQYDVWPGVPVEELHGKVTWTATFELLKEITPESAPIELVFDGQVCLDDGACVQVNEKLSAKFSGTYGSVEKVTEFRAAKTHAVWSATLIPGQLKPGQSGRLVITAKPDEGYHLYPFVRDEASTDFRTLIVATQKSGLTFGAPTTKAPRIKGELDVEFHEGVVEWEVPIQSAATMVEGRLPIELKVGFYTCTDANCDPPNGVAFNGEVEISGKPTDQPVKLIASPVSFVNVADTPNLIGWIAKDKTAAAASSTLTLNILVAALFGGFILNFMPCVLPVVGLKLMSFMNQAGTSHSRVVSLNLAFVGGILAVMMALAALTIGFKMFGQSFGWGQQFERLEFQVCLAVLVFAMALSFLGTWEIPIPGFATTSKSGELMSKEGHLGAFLKGILTTVLATPCSGPMLGVVFGLTLTLPPISIVILYATLGIGLGLPYLALCLYPGFVKLMPKPGAWMDTLKQVLAFPLLLTVVYIVQIIAPDYRIATLILLIVVWFGCWMIGQVPSWSEPKVIRRSWLISSAVVALGAVISFGFFGPIKHHLKWEPYNEAQLAEYHRQGKTVMIEFTARWCLTCQTNMRTAIDRPVIGEICEKRQIVTMLADKSETSPHIDQKLQELGWNSIPLVAILPPNQEPILLPDLLTQSKLAAALEQVGSQNSEGAPIESDGEQAPPTPKVASNLESPPK